jgi:NAD kinase
MRYFVSAADDGVARRLAKRLRAAGIDVVEDYDEDAVVVSVGGDGAILYNARQYAAPTILPVVEGDSEANKIHVGIDDAVDRIRAIESGDPGETYRVETHHRLGAYRDGEPVRPGFAGMNDVHLHHTSPVRAAKFAVRIRDDGVVYETEKAIGDGVLVATPFGSTAYYRSLTGGTFESGVGVAFNNRHKPADAPEYLVLSGEARVEVELLATRHGPNAALFRDDDPDPYTPDPGERVVIRRAERSVEVVRPFA